MKSYQVPKPGMPLQEVESPTPKPTGREVVVKTIACGVCHTDIHLHSGAFDLGEGNKLNVPVPNPFTLDTKFLEKLLQLDLMQVM